MRALSIQQPWAWLIVNGYKPVENRTWTHPHRGRTLIHAGLKMDAQAHSALRRGVHPATHGSILCADLAEAYAKAFEAGEVKVGGIVGEANFKGWFDHRDDRAKSPWFVGPIGYEVADAKPLPFFAMPGKLGFFHADQCPIFYG